MLPERRRTHAAVHPEYNAIPAGRHGADGAAPSAAAALAQTGPAALGCQRCVLPLHGRRAVGHSAAGAVSAGHTPPLSAHGVRAVPRSAAGLRERAAAAAAQCADDHPLWLSLAAGAAQERPFPHRGRCVPAESVHRAAAAPAAHRPHRRHHRSHLQHCRRSFSVHFSAARTARAFSASCANWPQVRDCAPSDSAQAGLSWTSTSSPSAPAATAASASGCTSSARPAA